jgi:site-specific DNA-methyltransferase (adenine-specific)/modification methylase
MIELNKIYNEDCFDTMAKMADKSINLVLTSPPYNMTKRKGGYADSGRYDVYKDWKTEEEYLDFTKNVFDEFNRVITDDGVVIYNFGYSIENPALPYKLVTHIVEKTNWRLVDTICWKKSSGLPFPANKCRLSRTWEFIFIFAKDGMTNNFFIDKGVASVSEKTKQTYYNVFYNFIEAKNNDVKTNKLNQATFSSELVTKLLSIYGGSKDFVVYDPFMGTGTTAVGCLLSEKHPNYIGSEISSEQVKYSLTRIEELQGTKRCETVID